MSKGFEDTKGAPLLDEEIVMKAKSSDSMNTVFPDGSVDRI